MIERTVEYNNMIERTVAYDNTTERIRILYFVLTRVTCWVAFSRAT